VPINAQELGARLRAARESCTLTQDDVAKHLGVSRSTVAQIELGNRAVSSIELDRLAFFFGRDIRDFVSESFEEEDALAALFRAEPQIASQEDVAGSLRACVALGREITNLEKLLGLDRELSAAVSYQVPAPRSRWEAIQQGERAGDQERRRLGLGSAPAPSLEELLETQAVRTGVVDLPDDVSGLTVNNRSAGIFIVANRRHAPVRRRFSFAHEYAHVLFDRRLLGTVSRVEDRDEMIEVRANAFAAAFLMPEDGVRRFIDLLGKGKPSRSSAQVFDEDGSVQAESRTEPGTQEIQVYDLVHLAHHYGVSRLAALFRLRNLRLVSQSEFDQMKAAEDAGRGRELASLLSLPDFADREDKNGFRHRVLALALEGFRRDQLTLAKVYELAELLSMTRKEVDQLLDRAGLLDAGPADVLIPSY
jgi:Zn-dependent peptidase ImmA (M78 family)/transcriptional regulator with XRE-family HTH domain